MKIKKGDKVKMLIGKDAGKTGTVDRVLVKEGKVLVGGLNMYTKHQKSRGEGKTGGIVSLTRPVAVSKVSFLCPKCSSMARVGYQITAKEKVRICKKCKAQV